MSAQAANPHSLPQGTKSPEVRARGQPGDVQGQGRLLGSPDGARFPLQVKEEQGGQGSGSLLGPPAIRGLPLPVPPPPREIPPPGTPGRVRQKMGLFPCTLGNLVLTQQAGNSEVSRVFISVLLHGKRRSLALASFGLFLIRSSTVLNRK